MDTAAIIDALQTERDRVDKAIAALRGGGARRGRKPGRRARGVRRMSAAARKRISLAQKKRWAESKGKNWSS